MSTFSGLNTAYTGLVAARQGLDVVGQNIANANSEGYTRQRVTSGSIGAVQQTGRISTSFSVGQGVQVTGIDRLGNSFLDARVRTAAATSGYWGVRSTSMSTLEDTLQEPGANGLSAQLTSFWAAWQDVGNNSSTPAAATVLLAKAGTLSKQIANNYTQVDDQWAQLRTVTDSNVASLNDAGAQVADLNGRIRSTLAAGGSANELIDQRDLLTNTIASLAGGTVRDLGDGTTEVLVGGNAIVSGDSFHKINVVGSYQMAGAATDPVHLEWDGRPGTPLSLEGGELGGALSMLAPADASGTGGPLAEAAESYNRFATNLAAQVNTIHETGATADGTTGLDFFGFTAGVPAALGLTVIPADSTEIASGAQGAGGFDGSIADAIAQLGTAQGSPDSVWSNIVIGIGVATKTSAQQSALADLTSNSAMNTQLSNSAVDIDEENINMLSFQRAYQGAARMITAVDQLLDTLINHTGIVGM